MRDEYCSLLGILGGKIFLETAESCAENITIFADPYHQDMNYECLDRSNVKVTALLLNALIFMF